MKRTARITVISLVSIAAIALAGLLFWPAADADAHCQIPCGIYGDKLKFDQLEQHIQTIEKSMRLVRELSAEPGKNANQLIRWVNNKDDHADMFAHEITYYFLQQRIKIDEAESDRDAYLKKLELCHQLLVYAMKCKQTTDQANADKLRSLLKDFEKAYMGKNVDHEHADGMSENGMSEKMREKMAEKVLDKATEKVLPPTEHHGHSH
jgi:hypothetical protein